ncbi:unnamed protein product, partial [Vitis vinifera]|uniref:Uncharacterized protein n=1 Tax=Vitis vinifera TaxID=29760 RepID=D7U6U5_VITVI
MHSSMDMEREIPFLLESNLVVTETSEPCDNRLEHIFVNEALITELYPR